MTHELPFTLKHKSFATFYNNRRALYRKIKSFQRKVFYYSTKLRTEERKALHAEYIAEFRLSFGAILDNTVIQYPDGTKKSLKKDQGSED